MDFGFFFLRKSTQHTEHQFGSYFFFHFCSICWHQVRMKLEFFVCLQQLGNVLCTESRKRKTKFVTWYARKWKTSLHWKDKQTHNQRWFFYFLLLFSWCLSVKKTHYFFFKTHRMKICLSDVTLEMYDGYVQQFIWRKICAHTKRGTRVYCFTFIRPLFFCVRLLFVNGFCFAIFLVSLSFSLSLARSLSFGILLAVVFKQTMLATAMLL